MEQEIINQTLQSVPTMFGMIPYIGMSLVVIIVGFIQWYLTNRSQIRNNTPTGQRLLHVENSTNLIAEQMKSTSILIENLNNSIITEKDIENKIFSQISNCSNEKNSALDSISKCIENTDNKINDVKKYSEKTNEENKKIVNDLSKSVTILQLQQTMLLTPIEELTMVDIEEIKQVASFHAKKENNGDFKRTYNNWLKKIDKHIKNI
jgi:hypothetical protein